MGSSTGTRNFGMRRFTNIVREGRLRTAAGSALQLGSLVEQNPAAVTEVREADATTGVAVGGSGNIAAANCGILWYEHDAQTYNTPAFGAAAGLLLQDLDTAPAGRMVQMIAGKGVKVWLRNTLLDTTEPGLNFPNTRPAVTIVDLSGTTVGELLGWNATTNLWEVTVDASEAFMVVTSIDSTLLKAEATLLV